jgi:hypothetical protein
MTDKLPDFSMDKANLYREEVYTDQKAGTLRKMIPVTDGGEVDSTRQSYFVGETQVMTPMGALPVTFELQTESLAEAVEQYGSKAQEALKETLEKLRELQRQQASSIVVPGQGEVPPMGGVPGASGKIKLP